MPAGGNIVIGDESALYLYMHCNASSLLSGKRVAENPLVNCAASSEELSAFNEGNPLYGPKPIKVLVPDEALKRRTSDFVCSVCGGNFWGGTFFKLREGLYIASPELVLYRLAQNRSEVQTAEIALNLFGRYYTDPDSGEIHERSAFITAPDNMRRFLNRFSGEYGARKLRRVLKWVVSNSGSPLESKTWVMLCAPLRIGGYGLPFDAMNYDIRPGRMRNVTTQQRYSIDLVNVESRFGVEYDGEKYHLDASKDKQRRNELAALGWTVLPLDKEVIISAAATDRAAMQIARQLGVRIRKSIQWDERNMQLRKDLDLLI